MGGRTPGRHEATSQENAEEDGIGTAEETARHARRLYSDRCRFPGTVGSAGAAAAKNDEVDVGYSLCRLCLLHDLVLGYFCHYAELCIRRQRS